MKNVIALLLLLFLTLLISLPSHAQVSSNDNGMNDIVTEQGDTLRTVQDAFGSMAPPDTLCLRTEVVRGLERDLRNFEFRDSLQTEMISEMRSQNRQYRDLVVRDSLTIDALERRVEIAQERVQLRDESIASLREEVRSANRQRYWWFAGGVAVSVGAALIVNALAGDSGGSTVVVGGGSPCNSKC